MLNKKFVAYRLRKIAALLEENSSILQKADELIQSNPAEFKKLWNSDTLSISGPFGGCSIYAILPSELNRDKRKEIKDSKDMKDDIEEWLDDEEAGIIMECAVDQNPKIYLKIIDNTIGAIDYIGLSSFSSYPYSSEFLSNGKRLNKETMQNEDWDNYYNPLLNLKDKIENYLQSVL